MTVGQLTRLVCVDAVTSLQEAITPQTIVDDLPLPNIYGWPCAIPI